LLTREIDVENPGKNLRFRQILHELQGHTLIKGNMIFIVLWVIEYYNNHGIKQ